MRPAGHDAERACFSGQGELHPYPEDLLLGYFFFPLGILDFISPQAFTGGIEDIQHGGVDDAQNR